MCETLKRIYKNSYNTESNTYNELILTKAVEKQWIKEEEKEHIIAEVG